MYGLEEIVALNGPEPIKPVVKLRDIGSQDLYDFINQVRLTLIDAGLSSDGKIFAERTIAAPDIHEAILIAHDYVEVVK